jgi:hypothetical protein
MHYDKPRNIFYSPISDNCQYKKSFMTPCVITDGHLAEADDRHCVGCGRWADIVRGRYAESGSIRGGNEMKGSS